jgi:uncharacterized phage protein (TIGR02218 family)
VKSYSPAYAAHLRQPVTTLAICWRVEKNNGQLILGTDHDRDITISSDGASPDNPLAGTYLASAGITGSDVRSSSDMSVDNMEVVGALAPDLFMDITVADIESGVLDAAPVYTFQVNWSAPDDYQDIKRRGYLGDITRTSEGRYQTEIRGLTQVLQQTIGRNAGDRCDVAEFGDSRCKKDVAAITVPGTVTSVTSRRRFNTSLTLGMPAPVSPYFRLGKLTWLTGNNTGFTGQVKLDNVDTVLGNLEMWENFPLTVQIGDTFTLTPGCDRRYETCKDVHNNLINMRAPGLFVPGMDEIIRAP